MAEHESSPNTSTEASSASAGTEGTAVESPPEPQEQEAVFTHEELELFEDEDETAGRNIGKMLSLFFFYTVAVMTFVVWWTWKAID